MSIVENNEFRWRLLNSYISVEIWQTCNGSYLTCAKYNGIFKFVNTYQEAQNEAIKLLQKLK
jgi:hypothetical protein